jgi:hypothetical protein
MAAAINAVKSSAITIRVQNVIDISNIKTCILRYAIKFIFGGETLAKQMLGMGIASL